MNTDRTEHGTVLLRIARAAIAATWSDAAEAPPALDWLQAPGASFVTLRREGLLRGCIGTLEARRALGTDVAANACAAAFRDPRFAPLARAEFDATRVEVSVLSAPEPLPCTSQADALVRLRPGVDGIVLECGERRATFLPQVWDTLPDPFDFLEQLRRKAGLGPDYWSPALRLSRYTVEKWAEADAAPDAPPMRGPYR